MLYKDYIIYIIDRRQYYWTNYYGVQHPINDPGDHRLQDDWKYAAKAYRYPYPHVPAWTWPLIVGAETPAIAWDLIKLAIDLHLLNESRRLSIINSLKITQAVNDRY